MLIERYRRWFDYEKDSHGKTLASIEAVPPRLWQSPDFQKAVDLLAHVIAARWLWLYRFGATKEAVQDLFPKNVPVSELPTRLRAMEVAWSAYLTKLDDDDLARRFEYQSLEGPRFQNTVEDILTQLFGHSWYHRGQIAALVRAVGAEPAVTDFVYWTRTPL